MKACVKFFISVSILLVAITNASAQRNDLTHFVGVSIGGGSSHLFLGNPFLLNEAVSTPKLGGGFMGELYYQLQYKHFLLQTGLGLAYTTNRNRILVDDLTANILEYSTMQYHYTFQQYFEQTNYGVAYLPVLLGANFKQWYFMGGVKLGLVSLGNTTQAKADLKVWATDDDIVGPLENMPNHGLQEYRVKGSKQHVDFVQFNPMLSAEVGIKLNKSAWQEEKKKKMDRAERYREAKRKKTLKELTNYRLALFADYGLTNIHTYHPNPVPFEGEPSGGLITMDPTMQIKPYSILGYQPYKNTPLHNLMVGVKLNVQFEIPRKQKVGLPYVYVYVQDKFTDTKLSSARVKIKKEGSKSRSIYDKYTDTKHGRVGKGFTPGQYWTQVSHNDYCTSDTIRFVHRDDFDTLYVALTPLKEACWIVEDALTLQPLSAQVELRDMSGEVIQQVHTNADSRVCFKLDNRLTYNLTARAEGYEHFSQLIACDDTVVHILMMPIPKKTFILQNMHFATAQTTILPSSQKALDLLYELLSENPNLYIRIVGHTDDVGSDKDNQVLSEGRANTIYQAMIKRGISAQRIKVLGKGESEPLVPNTSEANRQKNRRVEIDIISGGEDVNIERLIQ